MSLCTADQIAEKRRIALERLNAKKQGNLTASPNLSSPGQNFIIDTNPRSSNTTNTSNLMRVFQEGQIAYNAKATERSPLKGRFRSNPYPKISPYKAATNANIRGLTQELVQDTNYVASSNIRIVVCTLSMVSEHRFGLKTSEFHSRIVDICKTIPSRSYDRETRIWSFDLKDYSLLEERIGALSPHVVLKGIHKKVMAIFTAKDETDEAMVSSCMNSISSTILDSLMPFQKEGVAFGIKKQGRLLIADEMGLGKTYQALALADLYKEDWPLLIATTASTRDSWVTHIRKLMPYVNCHHIACITASHEFFDDARVVVCSYPMMEKCLEKLESMHFGVLIMDESHTLKNSKAKCTKIADKLARKARRVILLSGTPALSRPLELFSQLRIIDKTFLAFMDYSIRYCEGKQTAFGWDATGQSNLEELKVILSKKFMIRRTKAEVLPQLAEKNRETVYLDEYLIKKHTYFKDLYKKLTESMVGNIRLKEEVLIQYYAQTAEVKREAVCFYLKSIIEQKIKFIVFAHHKVLMDAICEFLKKSKVRHVRIDGSTKNELRAQKVNQFQTKDNCRVAVLSLRACNAGISLTATQLIIFAELDWNPSTLAQAESRAHRIGQEGDVTCRYLLARNTADDIIWKMLHDKQEVLNKAGLFSEDLRNSEQVFGPSTAGNIQKFLKKTPRQLDFNLSDMNLCSSDEDKVIDDALDFIEQERIAIDEDKNESKLKDLLDDGDDDDFANLNF